MRREDDAVEIDFLQVLGRRLRKARPRVLARAPGMVDAAGIGRQEAAAVDGEDLQVRQALENAVEDQAMQRDGGLQRVADDVGEVVFLEAPPLGEAVGMDHDEAAELLGLPPERLVLRRRQLVAVDVGEDLDALEAEVVDAEGEFLRRRRAVLQRHRAEAREAVRALVHEGGDAFVDDLRRLHRLFGPERVVALEGRRGDELEIDAHRVEDGDAVVHVRHRDGAVLVLLAVDRLRLIVRVPDHRDVGEGQVRLCEARGLRHRDVRVDVDRLRLDATLLGRGLAGGGGSVAVDGVAERGGVDDGMRHGTVLLRR